MAETYDVAIIGGGPGGYVCAVRAAQLGLSVACVEKRDSLGGTCLNVGCIPSKALLHSSHLYEQACRGLKAHGIEVSDVVLNLPAMMARKDKVVADNTAGIAFLFKKNKIALFKGTGRIEGPGTISVAGANPATLKAKHIVVATGSETAPLPGLEIDERRIISSTSALTLAKVPKRLAVIGAGAVGLELGSVWRRLGSEVTVVEYLDVILPSMDGDVRKQAQRLLQRQGISFRLGTKATGAAETKSGLLLTLEPAKGGAASTLDADAVLVAIGRRPYTEGLGLETVGIALDPRGFVPVDQHYRTSAPGVYAVGDAIGGAMLAHKAEEEGVALAELLAGQAGHVNYAAIPAVVYTSPEAAGVGKTEEQLKAEGVAYAVGTFPFSANGRARANGDSDGFVKVLADAATDRILGCHILGPQAGDLIQEVAVAMEFSASAEDVARSSHAHPQLGEAIKEAMLAVAKRPLHL